MKIIMINRIYYEILKIFQNQNLLTLMLSGNNKVVIEFLNIPPKLYITQLEAMCTCMTTKEIFITFNNNQKYIGQFRSIRYIGKQ